MRVTQADQPWGGKRWHEPPAPHPTRLAAGALLLKRSTAPCPGKRSTAPYPALSRLLRALCRFGALALPVGVFLLLQRGGSLSWDDALLGMIPPAAKVRSVARAARILLHAYRRRQGARAPRSRRTA